MRVVFTYTVRDRTINGWLERKKQSEIIGILLNYLEFISKYSGKNVQHFRKKFQFQLFYCAPVNYEFEAVRFFKFEFDVTGCGIVQFLFTNILINCIINS
ncbi:hypothetical protein QTP88_012583 [Uroleucon formosanum]